jgi:hypothetical protein
MKIRGVHGSVRFGFYQKKVTKPNFFFKKKPKPNRNRFKPNGFGSVWFFREKTGSNRFGLVFSVWLGFFRFGSVFSVWLGFGSVFFRFFFVRFGFSGSRLTKPKPNQTGRFFQMKIYTYVQADKCEDGQSVSFVNGDTNSQL